MLEEFEYNFKTMGTDCFISVVSSSKEITDYIYKICLKDINEYEKHFSRFLPDSELSILNKNKNIVVSKLFLEVTLKAYELFVDTNGIFNPLFQISRLGYDRDFDEIKNNENTVDDSIYNIDFSAVKIDIDRSTIGLVEGQCLDYGGFLKGYLAQIIAQKIKLYSPKIIGVIVNLGGDIHTEGLDKNGEKFIFNIYNPILDNYDIKIALFNQSLATSGVHKRSWFNFGKKIHHILNIYGNNIYITFYF